MVRLKGKKRIVYWQNNYISIPYGAIKSYILMNLIIMAMKFQFLMVRLKVFVFLFSYFFCFVFQFLMVRLKVGNRFW